MRDYILFEPDELLPGPWRDFSLAGPVRTFNPAILSEGNEFIFAYRVVGPDGMRRIALCRLGTDLRAIANSHVTLTDLVRFPADGDLPEPVTSWFADPRLYRFAGRVFIYWNSGWHDPRNYQFLQELDPSSLQPIGYPRELVLRGTRQKLEKNWTFFGDDPFYAVYSIAPHRVLTFSLEGNRDIEFHEVAAQRWDTTAYESTHGPLRGGAPPQLVGGYYWSFCHTVNGVEGDYRYAPAAYCFAAAAPFAPVGAPIAPLAFGAREALARRHPKLNPAVGEVIYPCGAIYRDGSWLISHGVNDERCAIAVVAHAEIAAAVRAPTGPG